jgi:hypothetical protein
MAAIITPHISFLPLLLHLLFLLSPNNRHGNIRIGTIFKLLNHHCIIKIFRFLRICKVIALTFLNHQLRLIVKVDLLEQYPFLFYMLPSPAVSIDYKGLHSGRDQNEHTRAFLISLTRYVNHHFGSGVLSRDDWVPYILRWATVDCIRRLLATSSVHCPNFG